MVQRLVEMNFAGNVELSHPDYREDVSQAVWEMMCRVIPQYDSTRGRTLEEFFKRRVYFEMINEMRRQQAPMYGPHRVQGKFIRARGAYRQIDEADGLPITGIQNQRPYVGWCESPAFRDILLEQRRILVHETMKYVSTRSRQFLLLFFWHNKLAKEIGRQWGNLSEGRMSQIKKNAFHEFRKHFPKEAV